MIRSLLIFFGLCAFTLAGMWANILRRQNEALTRQVHALEKKLANPEPPPAASAAPLPPAPNANIAEMIKSKQAELAVTRKKFEALRKSLNELQLTTKNSSGDSPETHIAADAAEIAKAQEELAQVKEDGGVVAARSKDFRESQNLKRSQHKIELDTQIKNLNGEMQLVRDRMQTLGKSRDPDRANKIQQFKIQLNDLTEQKNQTQAAIQESDLSAKKAALDINEEVRKEQLEMNRDREGAQAHLKELNADLDHWKKIQGSQSAAVRAQNEKVVSMRGQLAQLTQQAQNLEKDLHQLTAASKN